MNCGEHWLSVIRRKSSLFDKSSRKMKNDDHEIHQNTIGYCFQPIQNRLETFANYEQSTMNNYSTVPETAIHLIHFHS